MNSCTKFIVTVIVSQLVSTKTVSTGYVFGKHQDFRHRFEHIDPGTWHEEADVWRDDPIKVQYKHDSPYFPDEAIFEAPYSHNHRPIDTDHQPWHHPTDWNKHPNWYYTYGNKPNHYPDQHAPNHPYHHHFHGQYKPDKVHPHDTNVPVVPKDKPSEMNPARPHHVHYVEQYIPPTTTTTTPTTTTLPPITPPTRQPDTQAAATNTNRRSPLAIAQCIRGCPVTSEFNPVCGSNNVTYGNTGRLECAQFCGVDVQLRRKTACSAMNSTATTSSTSTTTIAPIKPTRFTTIVVPIPTPTQRPSTIPQDILNSIFTSTTTDENVDIDIRTRGRFPPQYVYPVVI